MYNGRVLLTLIAGCAGFLALILLTPLSLWQSFGQLSMAMLCFAVASGLTFIAVFRTRSDKLESEPVLTRALETAE
jgi:predicted RND superfamily exporter protein